MLTMMDSYKGKKDHSDEFYLQYYTRVKMNFDLLSQSEYNVTALVGALLSTLVIIDERIIGNNREFLSESKLDEYISEDQADKLLSSILFTIDKHVYSVNEQKIITLARVINHMRNALAHDRFSFGENPSTHEISYVRFTSRAMQFEGHYTSTVDVISLQEFFTGLLDILIAGYSKKVQQEKNYPH